MLSFQEAKNKAEKQLLNIKHAMDASGCYHPDDANIYEGLNAADTYELQQLFKTASLSEFLAKSGTTGIGGGVYLVAAKLHDELIAYSKPTDIVPLIGRVVTKWDGGDLQVNIMDDATYRPVVFTGGGSLAHAQATIAKPTITPIEFGVNLAVGEDLIEDNSYDIIDWHVQKAALTMGDKASELALTVLKTATDGVGTVNGGASGDANETRYTGATTTDIHDMIVALTYDRWIANTIVMPTEAWTHTVNISYYTLANNISMPYAFSQPAQGFHAKIGIPPTDVLFCNSRALHAWETDGDTGEMTNCVTIVMDRNNALLTGRKRWLEIKNYANPVEDLAGAVITARQDSVSLYNDAIGVITET